MCDCGSENKRTYYSNIQLFTEAPNGVPSGAAPHLGMKEITVCKKCGTAEFTLTESERIRLP